MSLEERSAATRRRQDDGRASFVMGRRQSHHEEIALYSLVCRTSLGRVKTRSR